MPGALARSQQAVKAVCWANRISALGGASSAAALYGFIAGLQWLVYAPDGDGLRFRASAHREGLSRGRGHEKMSYNREVAPPL